MRGTERVSYGEVADLYDETRQKPSSQMEVLIDSLHEELGQYERVLEVGVGTGRVARPLQQRGLSLLGIDVSRRMLARGGKGGLENALQADALHLPFQDESLDATLTVHVLHLIKDWQQALREVARVTRKAYYALAARSDQGRTPPIRQFQFLREVGQKAIDVLGGQEGGLRDIARVTRGGYYAVANYWGENRSPMGVYWRSVYKAGHKSQAWGIPERKLPNFIPPTERLPVGTFLEERRSEDVAKSLERRALPSQWALPDAVHDQAMEAVAHGRFSGTFLVRREVELLRWDVSRLTEGLNALEDDSVHGGQTPTQTPTPR